MFVNGPTGLDLAAIVDPAIRRAWTQSDLVTFTNTTNHGTKFNDNVKCLFGDASDAQIWYNGTDLIINPKAVGSGKLRVGAATTDQCNFYTYRMGLGDTVPSGGALLQATTTSSAIVGVFSATLTHTGATATMRTMLFTAVHQGTSTTNVAGIGAVFTGNIDTDSATGSRQAIGVQASGGFSAGRVQTQGTFDYGALIAKTPGLGGTHTGGNIRSRNLIVEAEGTYVVAGATVDISVAAQFQGIVQILSDKKLVLEGSATALGDSYLIFNSASTDIDIFVDNTKAQTWDNDAIDYFVTQRQADNLATQFGTGQDVSILYTGTVWDFNILVATTEVVFNNAGFDTDFRIESDTDADMFFVNAGTNRVGISTNAPTQTLGVDGNFALETAGNKLHIKEGSNATMGRSVLVAGTVTVATTAVTANSEIFITRRITGGTVGHLSIGTVTANTSFVINSTSATETSTINWLIIEPA